MTATGRALDRLPPTPSGFGTLLIRADRLRRQRLAAARSPRWVELDRLFRREGVLGLDEVLEMDAIEDSVARSTRWSERGHELRRLSIEALARALSRTTQRAWRGWSDEDLWSLHQTLCRTLGAQLIALGLQTNSSPGEDAFDEWRDALHHHGQVLLTLGATGLATPGAAPAREDCQVAIRRSLLWVVDHLESLGW